MTTPPDRTATPSGAGRAGSTAWHVLSAALLLSACSRQTPQPPAEAGALRLVSTAPNLTECVYAVGAGALLVGRTQSCDYPPEVRRVPVVGGFGTPWLEPLLATRPTHVLETVLADPELRERLGALHIGDVHVPCAHIDDVPIALRQIGDLAGRHPEGERAAAALLGRIAEARAEAARRSARPRALLLLDAAAPITTGPTTFLSELLELAGAVNVAGGTAAYYRFSLEWLLQQNPDMILCCFDSQSGDPAGLFTGQTGWSALDAVRRGRVYTVRNLDAVCRPGPRLLEGLAELKRILALDAQRSVRNDP